MVWLENRICKVQSLIFFLLKELFLHENFAQVVCKFTKDNFVNFLKLVYVLWQIKFV